MRKLAFVLGLCLSISCTSKPGEQESTPDAAPAAEPTPIASASAPPAPPAPPKKAEHITLLAGGDVCLGRGAGKRILEDPSWNPFTSVEPYLRSADFRFVNLESQLSDQKGVTVSKQNYLVFTGPPGGADLLKHVGIDLVSVANNHAWDYGKRGFLETLSNLERVGVPYVGASAKPGKKMYEPTIVKVKGWKIAFFAVTHIWNQGPIQDHVGKDYVAWAAFDLLKKNLEKARRENDLVFVSYHGGGEYVDVPMQWTREFVNAVMKAHVDAVFGHHPHVPLGVGWYGGRPAFMSLGNLVFEMHRDYPWTGTSFMARMTFHEDGHFETEACPYTILGVVPMPFSGKPKEALERTFSAHLKQLSVTVGGTGLGPPNEDGCMPLTPPAKKEKK
jgi:poly-gamma-glutamate capsule biosynthesis protein CapA/YwtB (metallophosphatase superfamily)